MDPKDIKNSQERRSFRIEDDLIVEMYIAKSNELNLTPIQILEKICPNHDLKQLQLGQEFVLLSEAFDKLYTNKVQYIPGVTDAVQLINKKIDILAASILLEKNDRYQRVNISTGGIGMYLAQAIPIKTAVYFKITFPPRYYTMICQAEVVKSYYDDESTNSKKPYMTGFEFKQISDKDEQFLSQYILQSQIASRQSQ